MHEPLETSYVQGHHVYKNIIDTHLINTVLLMVQKISSFPFFHQLSTTASTMLSILSTVTLSTPSTQHQHHFPNIVYLLELLQPQLLVFNVIYISSLVTPPFSNEILHMIQGNVVHFSCSTVTINIYIYPPHKVHISSYLASSLLCLSSS